MFILGLKHLFYISHPFLKRTVLISSVKLYRIMPYRTKLRVGIFTLHGTSPLWLNTIHPTHYSLLTNVPYQACVLFHHRSILQLRKRMKLPTLLFYPSRNFYSKLCKKEWIRVRAEATFFFVGFYHRSRSRHNCLFHGFLPPLLHYIYFGKDQISEVIKTAEQAHE